MAATGSTVEWSQRSPGPITSIRVTRHGEAFSELTLTGRLAVIAGLNGAGKTSVLKAIARELSADGLLVGLDNPGIDGLKFHFPSLIHGVSCTYIDPVRDILHVMDRARSDANFSDFLEGVDSATLESDLLALARLLVGKDYTSVGVYEIDGLVDSEGVTPHFRCEIGNVSYDSFGAGRGELVALYLVWKLSSLPHGSIVLLEEPESGLAHQSQSRLITVISKIARSRELQIITTSHTPDFVSGLRSDNVILASINPSVVIHSPATIGEARRALGHVFARTALVLVEDVVAAHLLLELIRALEPALAEVISVRAMEEGDSALLRMAKSYVIPGQKNTVFLLADGDARSKQAYANAGVKFLPGSASPEGVARDLLTAAVTDGSLNADVELALSAAGGQDLHDWIHTVGVPVGGVPDLLRQYVVPLMLDDQKLGGQARQLIKDLSSFVERL